VADLLRGPLLAGRAHVYPCRWPVSLGVDEVGQTVTLPASRLNVAVSAAQETASRIWPG